MKPEELKKHVEWLQHADIQAYLASLDIPHPWFPAYRNIEETGHRVTWFSALVPVTLIPTLLKEDGWDLLLDDGGPSVWTHYEQGKVSNRVYCQFGNEGGIEPLVLYRSFHGMREEFPEVAQEFQLYHNLYPEPSRKRFLIFNRDGDEAEAVRYGSDLVEIRTDLLLRFCAIKQMALAIYVDSFRFSLHTLEQLGLKETRSPMAGANYQYRLAVVPDDATFRKKFETFGMVMGKKYILPGPMPSSDSDEQAEVYQEFVIGTDVHGKPVKHTCDPDKLANYFGKNPSAPHYLTAVFFRSEVLSKYYAEPQKYSVEDGYLRCGGLWGVRIDNDHRDYVVVWLGDLGRDLSESERNYWLSFNIPPEGRKISDTNFQRSFMAIPTDPKRPDLVFKHEYDRFLRDFYEAHGWDFFLPLHADDQHFLVGLRLLAKDNQAEFDNQLLALTKVVVDSINEKEIAKGLRTVGENDKGITKLEKFFSERGLLSFETHIKFLRVLQDLRSQSAAHRKGSNYEKLVQELQLADEGQQRVFAMLLTRAADLMAYLRQHLLPEKKE